MSATGRNRAGEAAKPARSNGSSADFCPTPQACADSCVALLPILPDDVVVDAGAGDGAFCLSAHHLYGARPIAVERHVDDHPALLQLRDEGVVSEVIPLRYERWRPAAHQRADWTIGNPPFKQAQLFLEHALFCTKPGGHIALLLRHGFAVTEERAELRRRFPTWRKYDLQSRPSFYSSRDDGGNSSDSTEYSLFVWRVGWHGRETTDVFFWNTKTHAEQVARDRARIRAADWPEYVKHWETQGRPSLSTDDVMLTTLAAIPKQGDDQRAGALEFVRRMRAGLHPERAT